MIHLIRLIFQTRFRRRGIMLMTAYLGLLAVSSVLITLAEPEGSDLSRLDQALWWSVVTSTTVGYGDIYPATAPGKLIAVILPMFMGIGLGAAFITHVASQITERRDQKMHGEKPYTGEGHILLVGHTQETGYLVEQILGDETYRQWNMVLLADLQRHPLPDRHGLYFIKGRPDMIPALKRANIQGARRIIIHTGSDETSLFALINALKLTSGQCEISVCCLSSENLDTFASVPGRFETIMQMTTEMMVQAMQDKVHVPLQILLKNNRDEEIYFVGVPDSGNTWNWWDLHAYLHERYRYLSFALKQPDGTIRVNPEPKTQVGPGCGIWLIAEKRPMHIEWQSPARERE